MHTTALSTRLLAGVFALLIASTSAAQGGRQGAGQGPPRGGRGSAPVRDRDSRPPADAPAGTSSIVGTVVVSGSGAPARRARVTISGEAVRGSRSVTTDGQGRYAFAGLPAGRFTLSASKAGHLAVTYGQRVPGSGRPGTPIQLEEGQRLSIQLQMPRGGVISGTVLDEEGEAVPGTPVRVFRYSMQSGVRTLQQAGSGATDDRGIYRIYGLQIGDYLVCALPRPAGPGGLVVERIQEAFAALPAGSAAAGQQVAAALDRLGGGQGQPGPDETASGYAPVYYPGTTATANATTVALNAGDEKLGIDFRLQLVPMARVDGMVIYPGAQEGGGLQVQMVNVGDDVGGPGGNSVRVDREGRFTFGSVAPGRYSLIARTGNTGPLGQAVTQVIGGRGAPGAMPGGPVSPDSTPAGRGGGRGPGAPRLWASMDLTVDGRNLSNLVLTLEPGFSLSGRLDFRGTTAQAPDDLTRMRVTLTPADPTPGGRILASAVPGRVDESGRFTIEGVTPGRYRLSAGGATGWSMESAVVNGQDALDFPLDIRSSQGLAGAVITFTDQQTSLTGVAGNAQGQAVSDYTLIVYPADQRYWLPQSRRIGSVRPATDGTFTLTGLPPGEYRIAPVLDPEPGSWFDPTVLEQLNSASQPLSLSEGEKKVQNVRVGS